MKRFILALAVFFLCLRGVHALDLEITDKELGGDFRAEYNRSLIFCGDFLTFGGIELNKRYAVNGGLALGWLEDDFEIAVFSSVRVRPLINIPLDINLSYNYNGLPGAAYDIHAHSLLPYVSFNGRWGGIAAGVNLRFTNFFGEEPVFESMLSFSAYINFINTEKLRIGIRCANFDDFFIKNMGAYSLSLDSVIRITGQWSIVNDLEFMQTGGTGLSTVFYGIAYRGGVRYTW